jgi:hypothetical protein
MNRWIGGPAFDGFFFFGGAALSLAAGLLMLAAPATVLPMWFAWLLLVEGPHLVGTWQRTYLDPGFRRTRGRLLWTSLLWMVPGPALLLLSWASGRQEPFLLFLGAVALWSFHHAVRQNHGIQSIYQRLGKAEAQARKVDSWLLHGILWGSFGLFLIVHPTNREITGAGPEITVLAAPLGALLTLAVVAWGVMLALRWRAGVSVIAGVFGLVVAVGTGLFSFFIIGLREPLLANPLTPEQVFMAATVVNGTLHGIQYIGIVIATERRRAFSAEERASLSARMGAAPMAAYAVMVVVSLLYVGLNLARGGAPIGAAPDSTLAQLFLALYWGLFCHHFWLDQYIWKPSSDARLRAELGLEKA